MSSLSEEFALVPPEFLQSNEPIISVCYEGKSTFMLSATANRKNKKEIGGLKHVISQGMMFYGLFIFK